MPKPKPKQKPTYIRTKIALDHLSKEQRKRILSGHNKQLFKNALRRLTHDRRVPRSRIPSVVRAAAKAVLKKPGETLPKDKPPAKNVIVSSPKERINRLNEFDGKKLKWLPYSHKTLLPNGAKAEFFAKIGKPVAGFNAQCYTRVFLKPAVSKKRNPERWKKLNKIRKGKDYVVEVRGSVGYMPIAFHEEKKSGKPVLTVWNVQERVLPELPSKFRKQYKHWYLHLIDYLSEIGKRAGAKKIAIISPEHIITNHRNIVDYYKKVKKKLVEKRGFKPGELELGLEDSRTKKPFLVKELK